MEDGSWGWNVFFFSIFFSFFPPLFQVYLKCASASVFCLFVNVTVNLFKKKKKKMEKLGRLQLSAAREDAKAACRLALAWPCKRVFL